MVGLLLSPGESDKIRSIKFQEIKRPDHVLKEFRVYIQDRGSGTRHLPIGSTVLVQDEVC